MKKTFLKQCYILSRDAFISSFFLLLGSGFLEFFYPGFISYYVNTSWLFAITFLLGMIYLIFQARFGGLLSRESGSKFSVIFARIIYIIFSIAFLVLLWKLFSGIVFLQVTVSLILCIIIILVYTEFLL